MEDKYINISDLNNYIKSRFDSDSFLQKVYLKGEISNFKNHTRGHLYFTLKDDYSRLSAVMFYNNALTLNFKPEDGMNVLVEGRISCYPAQGTYQIYVDKMETDGLGNLYIEYEKLKQKLEAAGLFAESHKKPIPKYPKKIGIITASTGAAVRDIISTIKRRYPICETILFPTLVQGDGAKENIAAQIKRANEYDLDVIICGRGGGSIEDLWAFNEEVVAYEIYNSNIPIISAVGHEPDFTIADYVADLRAPTPTGAAEMAVPTIMEINNMLNQYCIRLNKNIKNTVNNNFIRLRNLKNNYVLKNPLALYETKEQKLDNYIDILNNIMENNIKDKNHKYEILVNTLKLVNPLNILEKGYSLVKKDEKLINDSSEINVNDLIEIKFFKGALKAEVREVSNGNLSKDN